MKTIVKYDVLERKIIAVGLLSKEEPPSESLAMSKLETNFFCYTLTNDLYVTIDCLFEKYP